MVHKRLASSLTKFKYVYKYVCGSWFKLKYEFKILTIVSFEQVNPGWAEPMCFTLGKDQSD